MRHGLNRLKNMGVPNRLETTNNGKQNYRISIEALPAEVGCKNITLKIYERYIKNNGAARGRG